MITYPVTVGSVEIVAFDGYSYVDSLGRTYWSGGEESLDDLNAALADNSPALASAEDIKAEAQRRILLIAPVWRQMNYTARTLELTRDYGAVVNWPNEAQLEEHPIYQACWDRIKAIRNYSDELELNPPLLAELGNQSWPE